MRRIIETNENALEGLMGETVTLLCAAYFYTGKLTGVNDDCVELTDPSIVYETGAWTDKSWADAQELPTDRIWVTKASIEAFGVLK